MKRSGADEGLVATSSTDRISPSAPEQLTVWTWLRSLFFRREIDQVRDFVIEVGRCQLMCGLVEQQIHDLLRSFGYPDNKVPEWLAPGQNKRLKNAIDALKGQFSLPSSFAVKLHRFRERRNEFVHQTWSDPDFELKVGTQLNGMRLKVLALYRTAKELAGMFGPLLRKLGDKRYLRETERLESEIKYWKNQSAALGAALAQSNDPARK
jgi:hypothetical protein